LTAVLCATAADQFTVLSVRQHLKNDAWAEIGKVRQRLSK
jgi:hypothetical protein